MSEQAAEFDLDAFMEALEVNKGVAPEITISTGAKVTVKKATAAQVLLIMEVLKSVAEHLNLKTLDDMANVAAAIEDPANFLDMLIGAHDKVFELIAALCDVGVESIKAADLDDVIIIAFAEWKVNEHFFVKRLLPTLQKLGTGQELEPSMNETPEQIAS